MPNLTINGKIETFAATDFPGSGAELLSRLKLEPAHVVAEVDGEIVSRDKFAALPLKDGQTLELVRFVGGG